MPPLYVTEQGARIEMDNRRVAVSKDGEVLANVPMIHVSEVVIMGNVSLTTPAMKAFMAAGLDVVFLTIDGAYCGRLIGPNTPHVALRRMQYGRQGNAQFSMTLAQQFVIAKLQHQRVILQRHNRDKGEAVIAGAIESLGEALARAPRTTTVSGLMGVEGAASAAYFGSLKRLLKHDWKFEKRARRPPPDPINILLSYGYTLLTHTAEGAVAATGLDPFAGFLHAVEYNRPSMALDIVEEFRPLVDGVILWACNGEQVTPGDFTRGDDPQRPVVMSDRARKRFIEAYERRMGETFTHPKLNQQLTMRQCVLAQARQVAEAIRLERAEFAPMGFK
ncbi:MAG: CRISPR-associated endonuclease Cas1 [Chloroflexi bacterium]|nr:CRISPR-associated endonuclease Cas1 [Chloroflexota bacterium]